MKNIPQRIYLATHNDHKVAEIKSILGMAGWDLRKASELDPQLNWDEIGTTFEENAKIKAIAVSSSTRCCILAEDSGLCVDALAGEPGVNSNRYAGAEGDSQANIAKLLANLRGVPPGKRQAAFVCCLVYIDEEGAMGTYEGRCHGSIAEEPRGQHGFGYDSVFIPQGYQQTFGELPMATKNALSHRKLALEKWVASL